MGGALSRAGNPYIKGAGIAVEAIGALSSAEIMAITAQLKRKKAKLREYEENHRPLEDELKNLKVELDAAKEEFEQCQAGE
jgi:hypothetical protein